MPMNQNQTGDSWVKLEIFVPSTHLLQLQEALHEAGAGQSGFYDHVFAVSEVTGSFRPLEGSDAFAGEVGKISRVLESKLEVNCRKDILKDVLAATWKAHPYEVPVINVIPLIWVAD